LGYNPPPGIGLKVRDINVLVPALPNLAELYNAGLGVNNILLGYWLLGNNFAGIWGNLDIDMYGYESVLAGYVWAAFNFLVPLSASTFQGSWCQWAGGPGVQLNQMANSFRIRNNSGVNIPIPVGVVGRMYYL
jgi:hypothetical protein